MLVTPLLLPFEVLIIYTLPFMYYQVFTFLRSYSYVKVKVKEFRNLENPLLDPPLVSVLIPTKGEDKDLLISLVSRLNGFEGRNAFEIIIISDDPEEYVEDLRKSLAGYHNVIVLRRENPRGFKACALQYGFERSRGKYVITLDVDSVIDPRDILAAVAYLEGSNCDAVTFRWMGYMNGFSMTALGVILSTNLVSRALFLGRFGKRFATFPVGSGTMFKADSLKRVGGWNCDVVQDDLDVGARMIANGMRICPLDLPIYVEVPSTLRSFMIQQSRWALGTGETLRLNLMKLLKAKISFARKLDAIWYLLQYTPIIATMIAMVYLSILVLLDPKVSPPLWLLLAWLASLGAYGSAYMINARELNYPLLLKIRSLSRISSLSAGISFYIMIGFINGIRNKKVYKITPKGKNSAGSRFIPKATLFIAVLTLTSSALALLELNFIAVIWLAYYASALVYSLYVAVREG